MQEPSWTPCHTSQILWASLGTGMGTRLCPPPYLGQAASSPSISSALPTFFFCHSFPLSQDLGQGPCPGQGATGDGRRIPLPLGGDGGWGGVVE